MSLVYADYNATSPVWNSVGAVLRELSSSEYGNPSSTSSPLGRSARSKIEEARISVAELVDCEPHEIVFTSGGTEAVFLGLLGCHKEKSLCFASSHVEHAAQREAIRFLTQKFSLEHVEFDASKPTLSGHEEVASLMFANNETGIVYESNFSKINSNILFSDAIQAIGKTNFSFSKSPISISSISGHKFGALKGVGALLVKNGVDWFPPMPGGLQESGRRGGTENIAGIVSMGIAARETLIRIRSGELERVSELRNFFESRLLNQYDDILIVGKEENRIPNTSLVIFPTLLASEIVSDMASRGVVISAGSACNENKLEASHVLTGMGYSVGQALSALRFSFGLSTTRIEIDKILEVLHDAVEAKKNKMNELLFNRVA